VRTGERNPPSDTQSIPWISVGCARRDERVSFQRPLRERVKAVARASEGAAEECRSDERNTRRLARSAFAFESVLREARRTTQHQRPCVSA
jgi:hypothetical protein